MHGECDKIGHVKERRGGRTPQLPPVNPRCIFREGIREAESRQIKCQITGANSVSQVISGILSHLGAKLRDWAERQVKAGYFSWAELSSNDSKTR